MYKEKKGKAKKAVAMAKGCAYEDLYARLETKEGEKELYRSGLESIGNFYSYFYSYSGVKWFFFILLLLWSIAYTCI